MSLDNSEKLTQHKITIIVLYLHSYSYYFYNEVDKRKSCILIGNGGCARTKST